jgi:peptidoglycan-associated lipoprotein
MKNLYSTLFILFIGLAAFGQSAEIKKADKLFVQRAYIDAADAYEDVVDKDQHVLQNLGDAYFFTNQMENAAETYRTLFLRHAEITAPEYQFRFAHALRATGNQEEADEYMSAYTGEDVDYEDFARRLDTAVPHVYTTNQVMSNSSSADFGIAFYGDRIAFASTRNQERPIYPWNKKPTLDLYSAEISDDGEINDIVLFSDEINTDLHESSATFSKDGQVMYFDRTSEDRVKNEEGIRVAHIKIFRAEMVDGKWSNIEALPFTSDEYSTEHPSLSADGSKLYFASDMPGSEGSFDIYVVAINEDGTYGEPENLGTGVNTAHREQFPYIDQKGVLYFTSDGHQGFGNLDVYRTEGDFSEVQNLGNTVNSGHDDFAFVIDEENQKGYLASNRRGTDNLYVFTREDYVPPVVEYDDRETNPETGRQQLRDVGNIYFAFDKSNILPEAEITLNKVVAIMNKYPDLEIEIGSHADSRGSNPYNMALSERRAASTLEYIVSQGISRDRLTSKGYGETVPIVDCEAESITCTKAQFALNRRSEFTIMNDENAMDSEEMEDE